MNVVYSYVGRSLAHSAEKDGVRPQIAVAEVLERLKSSDVERGLAIERFNMRGVQTKALYEGGARERTLAQQYRDWSARHEYAPFVADAVEDVANRAMYGCTDWASAD